MEVILGIMTNTFGIKGEVKVHSNTSFAKKRYKKGNEVVLFNPISKERITLTINSYKESKGMDIISFVGLNTPEKVIKYKSYQILIEKPQDKLEKDHYYYADLLNCNVIYQDRLIGQVIDLFENGVNLTLRIKRENQKDLLYPFIARFVEKVDIENKNIYLNPIEGMID